MGFMGHILPNPVGQRKRNLPHLVEQAVYDLLMPGIEPKRLLWDNVSRLMTHHWGGENLTRLSREADIGPGTCTRMKNQETSIGIDILAKVASVFGLQAWHLLTPDLDPRNPPVVHLNRSEREMYERLRQAARAAFGDVP
jgi:hypothetical protein